jgi:hypothetical protein
MLFSNEYNIYIETETIVLIITGFRDKLWLKNILLRIHRDATELKDDDTRLSIAAKNSIDQQLKGVS